MNFTTETNRNVLIVTLPQGVLDASNSRAFKSSVNNVLGTQKQVVFDLSNLQFMDSSGVGAVLSCLRKLNAEGGDLKLCAMTKTVRALFELIRMHKIFDIFNSREEAVNSF